MRKKSETHNLHVVVLMGLQGAGKSSFYRRHFKDHYEIISKDLMKNRKQKGLLQEKELRRVLGEGKSVVVDNMNLTKQNRKDILSLAKEYDARTTLYYFPLSVSESLEKNKGPNRKQVPDVGIYSSVKNLEVPSSEEGFDQMFLVRMVGTEEFDVCRFPDGDEASFPQL